MADVSCLWAYNGGDQSGFDASAAARWLRISQVSRLILFLVVVVGCGGSLARLSRHFSFDFEILKRLTEGKVRRLILILECKSDFAWIMRSLF